MANTETSIYFIRVSWYTSLGLDDVLKFDLFSHQNYFIES